MSARPAETARDPAIVHEASDPTTPAERLRAIEAQVAAVLPLDPEAALALLTHSAPTITSQQYRVQIGAEYPTLAALAANPNTPVDVLMRLAGAFPAELCANPIFPLLMLERPNLPGELPIATVRGLLRYSGVPRGFLEWLAAYGMPDVAAAARMHVNLGGPAGDDWPALAQAELELLHSPGNLALTHEMAELGAVPEWLGPALSALDDNSSAGASATVAEAEAALLHPSTDTLEQLLALRALADQPQLRARIAALAGLPAELLRELAGDDHASVRAAAARNPDLPADTLAQLADDESPLVTRAAAENPAAPAELLDQLARDYSWVGVRTRLAVVRHPHVAPATLARLAGDLAVDVRRAVHAHPATPAGVYAPMLAAALADCMQSTTTLCRLLALAHPSAPPAYLEARAAAPDWAERFAIARNPQAPAGLLRQLADDGNRLVRAAATAALAACE